MIDNIVQLLRKQLIVQIMKNWFSEYVIKLFCTDANRKSRIIQIWMNSEI